MNRRTRTLSVLALAAALSAGAAAAGKEELFQLSWRPSGQELVFDVTTAYDETVDLQIVVYRTHFEGSAEAWVSAFVDTRPATDWVEPVHVSMEPLMDGLRIGHGEDEPHAFLSIRLKDREAGEVLEEASIEIALREFLLDEEQQAGRGGAIVIERLKANLRTKSDPGMKGWRLGA